MSEPARQPLVTVASSRDIAEQNTLDPRYYTTRLPGEKYPTWKLRMNLEEGFRKNRADLTKLANDLRKLEAAYGAWVDAQKPDPPRNTPAGH